MTNTAVSPVVGHARIRPLLVVGLWFFYGVMSFNQSILWNRVAGQQPNLTRITAYTVTLCLTWLTFSFIAIWTTRRFPFGQQGWWRSLLVHVPLMIGMSMAAVYIDRLIGPHFGFGRSSRYWQHYLSSLDMNLFYYAVIVALVTAADMHYKYRERHRKASELHTELVT